MGQLSKELNNNVQKVDKLKKMELSEPDLDTEIRENLYRGLSSLSQKFLLMVQEDKIEIDNIRDAKEIANIFQMLREDNHTSDAIPQVSAEMANFYNVQFSLPESQVAPNPTEIIQSLDELDENGVDDLINNRVDNINKENSKTE